MLNERHEILNFLIEKNDYQTYLEVGSWYGFTFKKVECEHKECCDPIKLFSELTYEMTSDKLFKQLIKEGKKYDIILIDGLHLEHQVDKDIINALQCLNDGGAIVLDDSNPPTHNLGRHLDVYKEGSGFWNGTVYKSIINLRFKRDDLYIRTLNLNDWEKQMTVIMKDTTQKTLKYDNCTLQRAKSWDYFHVYRQQLLNVLPKNEFVKSFS
jgi:hypothetical protein